MGGKRTVGGGAVEDLETRFGQVHRGKHESASQVMFDRFVLVAQPLDLGRVLGKKVVLLTGVAAASFPACARRRFRLHGHGCECGHWGKEEEEGDGKKSLFLN